MNAAASNLVLEPPAPVVPYPDREIAALRLSAKNGDAPAMVALGSRLLIGHGTDPDSGEALDWIGAAADHGDLTALNLMATLTAVGVSGPPDWPAALSYLVAAGRLGCETARGQLWLLARATPPADEPDPDIWRALVDKFDLAWWITPPERRPLFETPRVRMAEGFASAAVCNWIRRRAAGRMRPAMMYDGASKTERVDPHRTCSDYQFDILNTDLLLILVRERIAALTKLPTVAMEPPRVFHYALGEEIKPHYDRCGDSVTGYGEQGGYLGDRIVTFLLYLNDDFEGGDLDFPKTGFRCRGQQGDAVYFAHVDPSGAPDSLSLHAGLKVTRGEKWVLSQWIHDRPFGVAGPRQV